MAADSYTMLNVSPDTVGTKPSKEPEQEEKNLLREVEAFVIENKEEKLAAFYKSPRLRQFWGDEQEELESWRELFFDLIYVAVSFQLGTVIENLVVNDKGVWTIIFFFAQFFPLYQCWFARTLYLSRFVTNSYFHGVLDIIYALLIGLTTLFIGTKTEIEATIGGLSDETLGFNIAFAFSSTSFLAMLLTVFRSIELILVTSKYGVREDISLSLQERQGKAIRNQGIMTICRSIVAIFFVLISLFGAYKGKVNLFLVPLLLGFFAELTFHAIVRAASKKVTNQKKSFELIPLNVGFMIKRFGEFTMLMLGEGVLQIIITAVDADDLTGHFVTFVLAFILLSFIFLLVFYGLPYEPEEHAYRRSALAGLLITILNPLMFASIMGVGVDLKLILKNQGKLDTEDASGRALSVFLSTLVGLVMMSKMVNYGFPEITKKDASEEGKKDKSWSNVNFKRIGYSIFLCFMLPLLFLSLRPIKLEGPKFLSVALTYFIVVFVLLWGEHKLFLEGEDGKIEMAERYLPVSQELKEKYAIKSGILSYEDRATLRLSKRAGINFNVHDILHYLRKQTRRIDGKLKDAREGLTGDYDWKRDVEEVYDLAVLIRETFESHELQEPNEDDEEAVVTHLLPKLNVKENKIQDSEEHTL